ncbi:hypothetical protein [Alkalicoccus chagannorensis]|uniref:lmo0954 family membrane protein n=1 Tax=Alkalicoccus chagannorensis TaxID=427072 RepID=UPI0003FEB543|nr:hypothetical protein [Alkalicoccus chagannorensis]
MKILAAAAVVLALMIALGSILSIVMFGLFLWLFWLVIKQWAAADSTGSRILWGVVGVFLILMLAANTEALVGIAAVYFLYVMFRSWSPSADGSSLSTRFSDTVREDLVQLRGKKREMRQQSSRPSDLQETPSAEGEGVSLEELRERLDEQQRAADRLRIHQQEAADKAASRREQALLAQEEEEPELADYAVQDATAFEQEAALLKRLADEADEQIRELEADYQQLQHDMRRRSLEEQELERRSETARIRREMSQLRSGAESLQETPSAEETAHTETVSDRRDPEADQEALRSSLERKLLVLEKRHREQSRRHNEQQSG